ncbi:MAG: MFS transporter [Leptolyngbyaceae cyanobacterium]
MLHESDSSASKISEISDDPVVASGSKPQNFAVDSSDHGSNVSKATGFWPVLQNRDFLTLWSGQVFSQLADKVYLVLMIAIIASQYDTPGQTISGWVSAVMIAFTIPAILFGSLAGVYVDRWLKQPVLVLTNLLRGGLVLVLPLGLWIFREGAVVGVPLSFCLLLVITFLVSTLTQFFAPAEQAVMPLIVKDRNLLSANSLYTTTMMASVIIGFAVGEPLLAIADRLLAPFDGNSGIGKDILVGVSYCLAGLILMAMRTGESTANLTPESHIWSDIKEGLNYIQKRPPIRNAIIQLVLLFSVFAALAVLAVRLAELIPTLKSSQFGVLLASSGIGMGIGATLIGHFGQRFARRQLSLTGLLGMGAALGGLSMTTHSLWGSLVLIAVLGMFAATVGIPMQTTIQEQTPEEMRGKVFGLQNNLVNIALSLPLALAGVAESFVGLRPVLLGLAAVVIAGGLLTQTVFKVSATSTQSES